MVGGVRGWLQHGDVNDFDRPGVGRQAHPRERGAVVDLGGADEQDARRMPLGLTRILRSSPSASSLHVDASIVRDIPGTRKGALE